MDYPFDPTTESIYCSRCGTKCEMSGHMFADFIMCPKHGEFTMAPVVIYDSEGGTWSIVFDSETDHMMWETCKALDERHKDGSPYNPRESRVLL